MYKTLAYLQEQVNPGISSYELNQMGEEMVIDLGGIPSFKGLYGFNAGVCTSVNEVIIHGVPHKKPLQEGDIIGLDIGVEIDGWFGDAAVTVPVGQISTRHQKLIDCAKDALYHAISAIKEGMRFKELSKIIENFIKGRGFEPLRNYCGHGIGREPHEEPQILNYVDTPNLKQGPKIKEGMVFCLEPMICQQLGAYKLLSDKWSVVSEDGLYTSHYEHTIAIVNGKAQILTQANNNHCDNGENSG